MSASCRSRCGAGKKRGHGGSGQALGIGKACDRLEEGEARVVAREVKVRPRWEEAPDVLMAPIRVMQRGEDESRVSGGPGVLPSLGMGGEAVSKVHRARFTKMPPLSGHGRV